MREILCTLVLIALASANNSTKQLNSTKEESSISKRYIVSIPQYNSLLYTNSQVLPTQQLLFGNSQALVNYINNIKLRTSPYGLPNYYVLPRNNFIQVYTPNVVPSIQNNVVPGILQNTISQQVLPKQKTQTQTVVQQQQPPVQQAIPQQVLKQPVVQQIVPQILRQQVVPQVLRQQVVPQQIIPQLLRQQVVPQQIVPHLFRQQVIPQQIVPQVLRQQIIPQQLVPQLLVPQEVLQQLISQQILRQQAIPQQIIPQQQIVPQKFISQQTQNGVPAGQPQPVPTYYQNNVVPPLIQQRIGPLPLGDLRTPLQHQQQPEPLKNQVVVGGEPYPYEVPPGQNKIPVYTKVPTTVPQVHPVSRIQNLINSNTNSEIPTSYLQGQVNNQPQPVYGPPYLQTPNNVQQEVRIGYGHSHLTGEEFIGRGQENHRAEEPHTVYADPSLFSTENNQAVVRIGYGHLDQQVGHQSTVSGPQQIKLDIPISYESEANGYRYEGQRPTRKTDGNIKNDKELKEAENKT